MQPWTSRIFPRTAGSPGAAGGGAPSGFLGGFVDTATAASRRLGTASGRAVMNRTFT